MKNYVIKDRQELIPTKDYKYAHYNFEYFNPVQSRVFEAYDKDCNYIVSASTGVGKTICSELFLAYEIRKKGKKGIYISPYRSLSQEKIDDWTKESHHFKDLKIAICTNDYKLTHSRKKELEDADLIIMTNEILNCKVRNFHSEKNDWLNQIGTAVIDEFHILHSTSRGTHTESSITQFTRINPESRIILLSATVPNSPEIGSWISYLNNKDTYVLESTYRPVPLHVHYIEYEERYSYDENEKSKIATAIDILEKHRKDKFILFVHTKKTGKLLLDSLRKLGINCEYHNADLDKDSRIEIEKRFKTDPNLRVIVATSTLAAGINLPARRVCLLGCHLGIKEVDVFDIWQECGRAGRPGFDERGDAYILLPEKKFDYHKERIETPQEIRSQMLDEKCLAFHIVSEIHRGIICSREDVHKWYNRTLAYFQNQDLDDEAIERVVENLIKCGAIINEDGLKTTKIGMVSSVFYYSPYDVGDLFRNWNRIFQKNLQEDDVAVSMAIGNIDSNRIAIVSNAEKEDISKFRYKANEYGDFMEGAVKYGCCYYNLLNGNTSEILVSLMRNLQNDFERLVQTLSMLDQVKGKWNQLEYFRKLNLRMIYGVQVELVDLVRLNKIGRIKAKRLYDEGIVDLESVVFNKNKLNKILKCSEKTAEEIFNQAKKLLIEKK